MFIMSFVLFLWYIMFSSNFIWSMYPYSFFTGTTPNHMVVSVPVNKLILARWCIYASVNWDIIGSGNGLSPVWHQPIIWTNAEILSIRPWGRFSVIFLFEIRKFAFKERHLKVSSTQWWSICLNFNVFLSDMEVIDQNKAKQHTMCIILKKHLRGSFIEHCTLFW